MKSLQYWSQFKQSRYCISIIQMYDQVDQNIAKRLCFVYIIFIDQFQDNYGSMRFSKRMNVFSCDRLESRAHRSFILRSFVSNSVNVSKLKRTNFLFLNLFKISLMLGIFIRCRCSCYHCNYYNLTSLCVMFHIFSDGISRIR